MKQVFWIALLCAAVAAGPARAAVDYIPDPVYQSLNPEEEGPMDEMIALAGEGDVRAQFILGDLYAKGKGGLKKSEKKGAQWFETSAKNGYHQGFIRLAAMAKRKKKPIEAYKWYTLAIESMGYGDWRKHAVSARAALQKDAGMKQEDIDKARQAADRWKTRFREEQKQKRDAEKLEKARAKRAAQEQPAPKPEEEKAAND